MRFIGLFALLSSLAAPANAQERSGGLTPEMEEIFARGCGDDQGVDRCSREVQAGMHELYGIDGPASFVESRTQMRRSMYVDGYGNDLLAVTFSRPPGEGPRVSVAGPPVALFDQAEKLSAPISLDVWNRVLGGSEYFDRNLVPLEQTGGTTFMCLHGSFVVVESVDPPRRPPNLVMMGSSIDGEEITEIEPEPIPAETRIDAESVCANGLAAPFAYELLQIASENLPQCDTLDRDQFRGVVEWLAACQRLGGDRLAAGEAAMLVDALRGFGGEHYDGTPDRYFAGFMGDRPARLLADLDGGSLGLDMPHAFDVESGEMNGFVGYFTDEGSPPEIAPITLQIARIASDWVVVSWDIGDREQLDLEAFE